MAVSTKPVARTGKKTAVLVRITDQDKDRLSRLAESEQITLSELIRRALDGYIRDHAS